MATSPKPFTLGREGGEDGSFKRQASKFRDTGVIVEPGRYHLFISYACPWASRTLIVRRLLALEDAISLSAVDPIRDGRGWAFTGGEYTDPIGGRRFLSEYYDATDPTFEGRVSVPVLWDKHERRIVNNESGDLVRLLGGPFRALSPLGDAAPTLYPAAHAAEIDALNDRIYETVNNGVYRAGFATTQPAYEAAVVPLFETLDWLEQRLAGQRWLVRSAEPTEADWRLFVTLVRFDTVYYLHFKCNLRRIVDYPNLSAYARDLYQWPGVAETVRFDEFKRHYYGTHPSINPHRIIPLGPADLDFGAPAGRERLAVT